HNVRGKTNHWHHHEGLQLLIKCQKCKKKFHRKCVGVGSNVNRQRWVCKICSSADVAAEPGKNVAVVRDSEKTSDNDASASYPSGATSGNLGTSEITQISTAAPENYKSFIDNISLQQSLFAQNNIDATSLMLMGANVLNCQGSITTGAVSKVPAKTKYARPPHQPINAEMQLGGERYRPSSPARSIRSNSSRASAGSKIRLREEEKILKEEADIINQRKELLNKRKDLLRCIITPMHHYRQRFR
ncbi:PREDICTED: uncharacterized protein LOC108356609, partial [Rhagoletis zephyria]|uniref:uncharacterized protein LOC108356609 n=1 Tax=Rhagoletis zephyria TaxID=28612 RepID=UPI0008118612